MAVRLLVTSPNGSSPATSHVFDIELITIGRARSNRLHLDDPAKLVSKRHAEIQRIADRFHLVDLGSVNGVFLNGQRLRAHNPQTLEDGDTFEVGHFSIQFFGKHSHLRSSADDTIEDDLMHLTTRLLDLPEEPQEDRLRRAIEELALLNELAREIGASHDLDAIMQRVVERSLQVTNAEQGVITLIEDADSHAVSSMHTLVRLGGYEPYHLNESLLAWMQHHKRPLLLNTPRQHSLFRKVAWEASVRSILCVPLIVRAQLTGILALYNKKYASGFTDDDQRLLGIIAVQSAQVIENARLFDEEKALLKMQEEMRLAGAIQTNLLPKTPPDVTGYDIAGTSLPAQTVGGDYLDFIPAGHEQWAFSVGDVSGKGLPASLLMANVQATLRSQVRWSDSVKQWIEHANQLLCQSTDKSTFVTLFCGLLDARTHRCCWTNAGHTRPLLLRADGTLTSFEQGGLVLGFLTNQTYEDQCYTFQPGDVLLVFSDGIVEAMNERREQFGNERLAAIIHRYGHATAQTLVHRILDAAQQHSGSAPQTDDMTLLVIQRLV